MSAKWQRSRAWDDRFIPAWAWPVRFVLRAFSSISLAIALLVFVALYGVLASVPLGLLALGLTKALYALVLVGMIGALSVLPAWGVRRLMRQASPAARFTAALGTIIAGLVIALGVWAARVWPALKWDPAHDAGVRLFPGFVDAYYSTTVRRLPGFEMSELEFYGWWPLRLVLLMFVVNMIVATARRIEFRFVNIGVLTVHTGIVTIALGSMHYNALKQEGDMLLLAPPAGSSEPGPPEATFFDNTRVALWLRASNEAPWEQRRLWGLPRYNAYGVPWSDRELNIPTRGRDLSFVDTSLSFRVIGYAPYVDLEKSVAPLEEARRGHDPRPVVDLELVSLDEQNPEAPPKVAAELRLVGGAASERVAFLQNAAAFELVPATQADHWAVLTTQLPSRAGHAIVVETGEGDAVERAVVPVEEGQTFTHGGYLIAVVDLLPEPPFPIITAGFEGARSSVAVLEITNPAGQKRTRYVYHRFPGIDQDILGTQADGRPLREKPDPSIRTAYIDASVLQVYLREDGRAAVRMPGGDLFVSESTPTGQTLRIAPRVGVRVASRWPDSVQVERPVDVPEDKRQRDLLGNHGAAAIAVEVSAPGGWSETVWLPFAKYMTVDMGNRRTLRLPDGREMQLAFSRLQRQLPGIALQLVDFEMIPYPHSEAPRDYVSKVRVSDFTAGGQYQHLTRLNAPLIHRVPYIWSDELPLIANVIGRMVSFVAPNQFKFSQAGWDSEGWSETNTEFKAGRTDRPRAAFTILGVGNNPGIYVIAAGSVMMSVGIPWAFYVKPWLLKRRKRKIQEELARAQAAAPSAEARADVEAVA